MSFLLAILLTTNLTTAHSPLDQSPANDNSQPPLREQQVFVAGTRDPDWKNYQAFAAGINIYQQKKALAPSAPLRFVLRPQRSDSNSTDIVIRIVGEQTWAKIPVAANGTFELPLISDAIDDKAELVLNRKKGLYRWRPDIHTPDTPQNTRRLGDLRLECEVRWAIEQDELPYLMKRVFNSSGGPCHSPQIQVDFLSPKKIVSITMIDQQRRLILDKIRIEPNRHIYAPILHDASWPDDSLLHFEFEDDSTTEVQVKP